MEKVIGFILITLIGNISIVLVDMIMKMINMFQLFLLVENVETNLELSVYLMVIIISVKMLKKIIMLKRMSLLLVQSFMSSCIRLVNLAIMIIMVLLSVMRQWESLMKMLPLRTFSTIVGYVQMFMRTLKTALLNVKVLLLLFSNNFINKSLVFN